MPVNPYLLLCNLLFRKQPDFQPHNFEHNEKNLVYGRVRSLSKSSPTRYKSKTFQQNVDFWASLGLDWSFYRFRSEKRPKKFNA